MCSRPRGLAATSRARRYGDCPRLSHRRGIVSLPTLGGRVPVISDDPESIALVRELLEPEGHAVTVVDRLDEAARLGAGRSRIYLHM